MSAPQGHRANSPTAPESPTTPGATGRRGDYLFGHDPEWVALGPVLPVDPELGVVALVEPVERVVAALGIAAPTGEESSCRRCRYHSFIRRMSGPCGLCCVR